MAFEASIVISKNDNLIKTANTTRYSVIAHTLAGRPVAPSILG